MPIQSAVSVLNSKTGDLPGFTAVPLTEKKPGPKSSSNDGCGLGLVPVANRGTS